MRVLFVLSLSVLLCAATVTRPAAAEAPQDLSVYAGLYPGEEVEGVAFLEHPLVRAAVERAVSEEDVLRLVLDPTGPKTPIAAKGDLVLSWGCEAHNCGPHNWSLLITRDGSEAKLCYFRAADKQGSLWFAEDKEPEARELECPAE